MNTGEKNSKGRTIFRGPRGGEYVLGPGGSKIRSFTRATAAAPTAAAAPASPGIPGFTKTRFSAHTFAGNPRVYIKNSSKRYWAVRNPNDKWAIKKSNLVTNVRTGVVKSITNHLKNGPAGAATPPASHVPSLPASPPPHPRIATMMRLGNKWISKHGTVYKKNGSFYQFGGGFKGVINTRRNAYAKDPNYLYKTVIPYKTSTNGPAPANLNLKPSSYYIHANGEPNLRARVFFNTDGLLYYVTLNGRKISVRNASWPLRVGNSLIYRQTQRQIGALNSTYPRSAIPPNTPVRVPNRSSPELLANMMNQIYDGGRGSNINATRYTAGEREKLIRRLSTSIAYFKQMRNQKKQNALLSRAMANAPGRTTPNRQMYRNRAAAATERVGFYNDAVRAYTRGLRALKPLTKNVPASVRRMAATPNRYTPAPASNNFDAIYMPLERPHLVVKTPGVGVIYLNPNSFRGLVKDAARVNIPEANVRNWLRMARRNFPNEPLFRHPIATSKNVTASHIRFSRS